MDTTQAASATQTTETPTVDLTLKQRKWIKAYIETGNATEAAAQVYDCKDRDSANAIGSENLAKLSFGDLMEQAGLTDKILNDKLQEGLNATKQLGARIVIKKNSPTSQANGEMLDANAQTDDFIEVEDYPTRHKYLETALKIKGRLVNKTEVGGPNGTPIKHIIEIIEEIPVPSEEEV